MNNLMTKSLAQIVNADHRAANVFEKYKLDFCCKGKRTLQQACAENALKIEDVMTELETVTSVDITRKLDFDQLSLTELADYIVTYHHQYVKSEMPQILMYLQKVAAKHGDRHPEMKKVFELFLAVNEEMTEHMQKEELILFPRIKDIEKKITEGNGIIVNETWLLAPINVMESEHDNAGNILAEIRELTNNYTPPADACTTFRLSIAALQAFELDLHRHVHLENNVLFPRALRLFNPNVEMNLN